MGDEVSVWSNFWPHLSQTWQETSCVSCLRTLGLLKLSLALVASARQSLVSQKKIVFFLPGKPPCICGWELFHEDAVLWQGSASKLAPGVGLEGHKVTSGEWPPFHPGTRDLLVLGGSCPVFGKKDWGAAVVVNGLERLFYEKALLGKILALSCCQNCGGWVNCHRGVSLLQQASLVSQKWPNSWFFCQNMSLWKKFDIKMAPGAKDEDAI